MHQVYHLPESLGPGAMVHVNIKERQPFSFPQIDLHKNKSLFANFARAKRNGLGVDNRKPREHRVAVVEMEAAGATVVNPERRMRQSRVLPKKRQVIEASAPPGILVDFLQGHDVRIEPLDELGDLGEIRAQLFYRPQTLVKRQAPGMGDIEGQKSQMGHTSNKIRNSRSATVNRLRDYGSEIAAAPSGSLRLEVGRVIPNAPFRMAARFEAAD
jgi:hypothetical protein